jgi:hypothetical protein
MGASGNWFSDLKKLLNRSLTVAARMGVFTALARLGRSWASGRREESRRGTQECARHNGGHVQIISQSARKRARQAILSQSLAVAAREEGSRKPNYDRGGGEPRSWRTFANRSPTLTGCLMNTTCESAR